MDLYVYGDREARLGDEISTRAVIYEVYSRKEDLYRLSTGTECFASARGEMAVSQGEGFSFLRSCLRLRGHLLETAANLYWGDTLHLVRAMTLGDREGIGDTLREDLNRSGLSHLTVVSGLHLTLLSFACLKCFEKLGLGPVARSGATLPFVLFLTVLEGAGPSVLRAAVMMTFVLLGQMLFRQSDSLNSLGAAVILILLRNPYSAAGLGFWMSVLSVLGILVLLPLLKRVVFEIPALAARASREGGKLQEFLEMLLLGFSAGLMLMPVLLWFFGRCSLLSPLASALATPAAEAVVVVGLLSLAAGAVLPWLGELLAIVPRVCARILLLIIRCFAQIGVVDVPEGQWYPYVVWAAVLAAVLWAGLTPPGKRLRRCVPLLLAGSLVLCLGPADWRIRSQEEIHLLLTDHAALIIDGDEAAVVGDLPDDYESGEIREQLDRNPGCALQTVFIWSRDSGESLGAALLLREKEAETVYLPQGRYFSYVRRLAGDSLRLPQEGRSVRLTEHVTAWPSAPEENPGYVLVRGGRELGVLEANQEGEIRFVPAQGAGAERLPTQAEMHYRWKGGYAL